MRDRDELPLRGRRPQHDVGERQVREQLQVAQQGVQPVEVVLAGPAVGADELAHGRHPWILRRLRARRPRRRRRADVERRERGRPPACGRPSRWTRVRRPDDRRSRGREDLAEGVLLPHRRQRLPVQVLGRQRRAQAARGSPGRARAGRGCAARRPPQSRRASRWAFSSARERRVDRALDAVDGSDRRRVPHAREQPEPRPRSASASGPSTSYEVVSPRRRANRNASACVVPARMPRLVDGVISRSPRFSSRLEVGPSSRYAVGADEQRVVRAAAPGLPQRRHVHGVGERLRALQEPRQVARAVVRQAAIEHGDRDAVRARRGVVGRRGAEHPARRAGRSPPPRACRRA